MEGSHEAAASSSHRPMPPAPLDEHTSIPGMVAVHPFRTSWFAQHEGGESEEEDDDSEVGMDTKGASPEDWDSQSESSCRPDPWGEELETEALARNPEFAAPTGQDNDDTSNPQLSGFTNSNNYSASSRTPSLAIPLF